MFSRKTPSASASTIGRWRSDQASTVVPARQQLIGRLPERGDPPDQPLLADPGPPSPALSQREAISGVRVKLTSSEASVEATITIAKLRRNAPTSPVMTRIGPQTATSTRVIAMAANQLAGTGQPGG